MHQLESKTKDSVNSYKGISDLESRRYIKNSTENESLKYFETYSHCYKHFTSIPLVKPFNNAMR